MEYEAIEISKFLVDFKPLIHKTLQRLQIMPTHMDYEDYFQELQIHLLHIRRKYQKTEEKIDDETDRYRFTAYASKGLYWRGINMLKKNQKAVFHSIEDEDLERLNQEPPPSALVRQSDVYIEDFFKQARKRLTEEDYLLLLYFSEGEYTIDEITDLMQVSRSTIYERKERIQERLEGIKDCLKN